MVSHRDLSRLKQFPSIDGLCQAASDFSVEIHSSGWQMAPKTSVCLLLYKEATAEVFLGFP